MTFRSCAVSTGSSIIIIGGHNNDSTESLNIMLEMTKVLPKVNKSMHFSKRVIISITHVVVTGRRLDLWSVNAGESTRPCLPLS